jgi:ribosomal protein S18 acetylase RimI-like enzyme
MSQDFPPNINVRLAALADLSLVAALFDSYRQFYEQPADLALATRYIEDRMKARESVILVAEEDSVNVVGFCQMYPTFCSVEAAPIYALYDLFVSPAARKLGAGRALLLSAERHAKDQGMVRLDLTTAKANLSAQSVYESLGWERDEVFYAYNKRVV